MIDVIVVIVVLAVSHGEITSIKVVQIDSLRPSTVRPARACKSGGWVDKDLSLFLSDLFFGSSIIKHRFSIQMMRPHVNHAN